MKKFLYGRLQDKSKGNDFYILPERSVGSLHKAIANDMVGDDVKLLFLQNHDGVISFGVRERIGMRDDFGRLRCNFTGYQLEDHDEPAASLPFFDALAERFAAITDEAHECHRLLDADSECGKSLSAMTFEFSRGHFHQGNQWDEAVRQIQHNPSVNMLMIFDERGNHIHLPGATAVLPSSRKDAASSASPSAAASFNEQRPGTGIVSNVKLDDTERTVLPPLPKPEQRQERPRGFLRINWGFCNPLNWGGKERPLSHGDSNSPPEP